MVKSKINKNQKSQKHQIQPDNDLETFAEFVKESEKEVDKLELSSDDDEQLDEPIKQLNIPDVQSLVSKSKVQKTKVIKKLVAIFKQVARMDDNELIEQQNDQNSEVIDMALRILPQYFKKKLGKKKQESKYWNKLKHSVSSFLASVNYLLKHTTSEDLLQTIFKKIVITTKIIGLFPKYAVYLCQHASKQWSQGSRSLKLISYRFLRKMGQFEAIDRQLLFKRLFLSFARNSKFMSWEKYSSLDIMRQTYKDIIGIDLKAAYAVLYTYTRQLALHLGQVIRQPSLDKVKLIYNWQYINSFLLIGQCIVQHGKQLQPLMFPLVNIGLGVLKLTNNIKYYPLRIHIIRLFSTFQEVFHTYIPGISPVLIEMLQNPELTKRTSNTKMKQLEFFIAIKASKDQISNLHIKNSIIDEVCQTFIEYVYGFRNSESFPEIILPIKLVLKKQCKTMKNSVMRGKILQLVKVLEDNATRINNQRSHGTVLEEETQLTKAFKQLISSRNNYINAKVNELNQTQF